MNRAPAQPCRKAWIYPDVAFQVRMTQKQGA